MGELRRKEKTAACLDDIYTKAKTIGEKGRSKDLKRDNGIKDTYQEVFMERIFDFMRKFDKGREAKQRAVDEFAKTLPYQPRSPVWRIKGEYGA